VIWENVVPSGGKLRAGNVRAPIYFFASNIFQKRPAKDIDIGEPKKNAEKIAHIKIGEKRGEREREKSQ
jgi:hypothetical protein